MAQHTDKNKRPRAVAPELSNVPHELRELRQWVLWRYEWVEAKSAWSKVPYRTSGGRASSTDENSWGTFDACVRAMQQARSRYDGVGFVFTEDSPFVGVDLDECVVEERGHLELNRFAQDIVERFATYTELSPSQTGVHLIGRANEVPALKTSAVEIYRTGRYFTVSGVSWHDEPLGINDVDTYVRTLADEVRKSATVSSPLTVEKRIEMACRDPKVKALFEGWMGDYGDDWSRADLALCSKLAFYSGGDRDVLDRMFRRSQLYREKWDERHGKDTYGNMTLDRALDGRTSFLGSKPAPDGKAFTEDTRRLRIVSISDVVDEVIEYRRSGGVKGLHPGWDSLEPLYRPAEGLMTVVTGLPGSGKSTWVDNLMYNLSSRHGWRHAIAAFESRPIYRHMLRLSQIYLQRPIWDGIPGNATDAELRDALLHINPWFKFLQPDDDELDIDSLLAYVSDCIRLFDVNGFVLDPFTELDMLRGTGWSQSEAIEQGLRKIQRFTATHGIHTWVVAHPAKGGDTFKMEPYGVRPTLRSISGAAHFYNKADYGIVVHRDDQDTTHIHVDKVRNDSTGEKGEAQFRYIKDRHEFEELGLPIEEVGEEDEW